MSLYVEVDGEDSDAEWLDRNPRTRQALERGLPLEGDASKWGCELYFDVPVDVEEEDATEEVPRGGVAYWPAGNALCLFWGRTPASVDDEPRAAGPVNVVAEVRNPSIFTDAADGSRVEFGLR